MVLKLEIKVFVSSKMESSTDMERREKIGQAIWAAGFVPIMFSDSASIPFDQFEKSATDPCIEAVKHADFFIFILDDNITLGMRAEFATAKEYISDKRIIYLFAANSKRSLELQNLRKLKKKENELLEFESLDVLQKLIIKEIKQKIKSDVGSGPELIYEETLKIDTGKERHFVWSFKKGDQVIISITSESKIYAEFIREKEYDKRSNKFENGIFDFEFDSDRATFSFNNEIKKSGLYYLIIRNSLWWSPQDVYIKVIKEVLSKPKRKQ
jgi:hypothetical protein